LGFLHRQPLFATGMAATLQLLKGSGELKKTAELAGRSKDSREYDPSADDFGVKLEYRDEYGRKLTQKEAFRQLSYRFHGYGPGKKKLEKRLKAMEVQTKATSSRAGILDGVGGTMKSLTTAQVSIIEFFIRINCIFF
jgi:U4/U6.U5 tri-snRNP-associated protein 1